jgi:hypothetical protein
MEVLGWYANGSSTDPKEGDLDIHQQVDYIINTN